MSMKETWLDLTATREGEQPTYERFPPDHDRSCYRRALALDLEGYAVTVERVELAERRMQLDWRYMVIPARREGATS